MIEIRQGLNLPISGVPDSTISPGPAVRSVAVLGDDYHGMKPTMVIGVGDRVKLGQVLFSDKKNPEVVYTAPAAGTIAAINRGARRVLQSVVIDVDGEDSESFQSFNEAELAGLSRETVVRQLLQSGLWTALRTRPFSKVPNPQTQPRSIFVTAMDSQPLAVDPQSVIGEQPNAFANGLSVLTKLTDGLVHVCSARDVCFNVPAGEQIKQHQFGGVHPAGNVGTHIHFIDPVSAKKTVWTINYQDVIAIGHLFTTGQLFTERIISLAGPQVEKPRLIRTRLGANLEELCAGELKTGENRVISGSVFGGRKAAGAVNFLGRYHLQVSVLEEGRERPGLHYMRAGFDRFSAMPIYISKFLNGKKFPFTTSTNGSERAMVPIGAFEKVMPLDILPTQLLRALIVGDTETAQALGCLELDEEDLALCTYVCSGKYEYGPILRDNLTKIELEG